MTTQLITEAKKYFSDIRLFRYLNLEDPLNSYFDNIVVSEKILSMICVFEIIFRNKINTALSNHFGSDYLTNCSLHIFNSKERGSIKAASKEATQAEVNIKESRIIAELTLGFWCVLVAKFSLWHKCIYKIHPNNNKVKFKEFVRAINLINDIRNKIAHHERLIKKRPYNINHILEIICNQTLLLIDDKDTDFKKYIKSFINKNSTDIQNIISRVKKQGG